VGRAGIGVDNVDIDAATRHGVIVMNTPGANSIATAEQTLALLLGVSRHTAPAHESLRQGEWKRSSFVGTELSGKTLGVVGFGRIGRLVAARAQAFDMKVIAYDPYVTEETALALDVTLYDLDDLLAQADYVTLHSAQTPDTIAMINAETISMMKEGAILINVARGKLVDEQALRAALDSGKLRAAAIDVYTSEPPPADHPLIGHPKVLHTPHLGASSTEAQRLVATQIVSQVLNALRGTSFENAINLPFPAGLDFNEVRPYMRLAEKIGELQAHMATDAITRIEVEVRGETVNELVRPIAAALLKGLITVIRGVEANLVNAPQFAEAQGIRVSQIQGLDLADYQNQISCRVVWDGGERVIAGVLFGGSEPRIVQVDGYHLDANPTGWVLIMQNRDVPGVIGQIGTILAAYEVNIGEWRMGRYQPGGEALSFINLDGEPPSTVLDALSKVKPVTFVTLLYL
jgi:D-3-phosphoglycerate dehydrogenase